MPKLSKATVFEPYIDCLKEGEALVFILEQCKYLPGVMEHRDDSKCNLKPFPGGCYVKALNLQIYMPLATKHHMKHMGDSTNKIEQHSE